MIGVNNQAMRLLCEQLPIISEPIPQNLIMEIDYCIQNLLSEKSINGIESLVLKVDLKDSLNWFRKSPSKVDSQELEESGFEKYSEIHDEIDSTLIAQHLKKQLLKINLGLLPESICNLILILIQDNLSDSLKGAVWLLLSLSDTRFKIIQNLLLVTNRIRSETNVQSKNLATVVLVHKLKQVNATTSESITALREEMERWNQVWGFILEDNDFLIKVSIYV
jgi:hypothetical protein